jgi:hypothetical protein
MGAIANVVLPDAAGTPVNHTFIPLKVDGDTARWIEQSNAAAIGYWPLLYSLRAPTAQSQAKVYRANVSLVIPIVTTETINGVSRPRVEYTMRASAEFVLPQDSTLQNRKDLRKLLVEALNTTLIKDGIETLVNVF